MSLQLRGAGYETVILKAPPTGPEEILLRDMDLLLVSPGLDHDRRREGLAALEDTGIGGRVPVLTLVPGVQGGPASIANPIGKAPSALAPDR